MVALPAKSSPTLDAILASYVASAEDGRRAHLGASLIGTECERALWYGFRWVTHRYFDGRMLRLFQTGHLAEARFVADLKAAGIEVYDTDPETGRQFSFRDETGHFGGSMDGCARGVLEAPKAWHVCEFKTSSEKAFGKLKADGVQKAKPLHYAQMQTYMHMSGLPPYKAGQRLERALYIAVNKNTDELYIERLRYDADFGARMLEKAQRVIGASVPPSRISDDPSWWQCRFCDHRAVCHEGAAVPRSCRTCMHATPAQGGDWTCAQYGGMALEIGLQKAGCASHAYIPPLVPGEQIDAGQHEAGVWVRYRLPDGSEWTDGPAAPAPAEAPGPSNEDGDPCCQHGRPLHQDCLHCQDGQEEAERQARIAQGVIVPSAAQAEGAFKCCVCDEDWPNGTLECPSCGNDIPF